MKMRLSLYQQPLQLQKEEYKPRDIFFYIIVAYLFGILIRLIALFYLLPDSSFWQADGTPVPLLTHDTGLYGFYALEILKGNLYTLDTPDRLPAYLLAFVTYITSANMDWVIFILPLLIASLVVVPVILIGKTMGVPRLGFYAALFTVSSLSFYQRSHISYFDTDILNLFFPMMIIWVMMQIITKEERSYLWYGGVLFWVFGLWYHSSVPISAALVLGFLAVTLLFYRQNKLGFQAVFVFASVLIPLHPLESLGVMTTLILFFLFLDKKSTISSKHYFAFLGMGALLLIFVDLSHFYQRAVTYFDRPEMITLQNGDIKYHFLNQLTIVSEAVKTSIIEPQGFFNRQSSVAILSIVGFILLCMAYTKMLVLLPLFLLGASSYFTGSRFMMYAAPPMALGLAYLIVYIYDKFKSHVRPNIPLKTLQNLTVATILFLMAEMIYEVSDKHFKVFHAEEVTSLRELSKQLDSDDRIVTWWDYGWPLWYYTGYLNTLIDNGAHGRYDSYLVSKLLLSTSQTFTANAALYISKMQKEAHMHHTGYALEYAVKQGIDLNDLMDELNTTVPQTVEFEGDVYILLHSSMFNVFQGINLSSDFDLLSGKRDRNKLMISDVFEKPYSPDITSFRGNLFTVNTQKGTAVSDHNKTIALRTIAVSKEHKSTFIKEFDHNSSISLSIAKGDFAIYMDNEIFDSFYIQAYLFDNYDKRRFKKVIETKYMKIFKVLPAAVSLPE